jgi:hypothetical protein
MRSHECTTLVPAIPEELTCFDVQERHGELTAKVGVAELMHTVDWLVSKGLAHSRLKVELRRKAHV